MSKFEQHLRDALARREPPAGFADRVVERARFASGSRIGRVGNWVAAGAVVAILVGGIWIDTNQIRRVRGERAEIGERAKVGERAKEEVLLAFRITGATLRSVREQVQQIRSQRD